MIWSILMQLDSKNCLLGLKAEYPVRENVYVLESGDDVTPQFDKIMPLAPDTVPEINIEPNHGPRNKQLRSASSLDNLAVEYCRDEWPLSSICVTGRFLINDFFLQAPWL